MKLMIIDDDEDDRDFFSEAVFEIVDTATCIKCADAENALKTLRDGDTRPDIIFLDLNMPKIDGRQCLSRLKANDSYREIPVVIFSTSRSEREKKDVISLGAKAFITKPCSIKELVRALRPFVH